MSSNKNIKNESDTFDQLFLKIPDVLCLGFLLLRIKYQIFWKNILKHHHIQQGKLLSKNFHFHFFPAVNIFQTTHLPSQELRIGTVFGRYRTFPKRVILFLANGKIQLDQMRVTMIFTYR